MCIQLSSDNATFPSINSLGVALSLFLGAEAGSRAEVIRLISCNTCSLDTSLVLNPYYYILFIQLSSYTATFPSINSLGAAFSLFLGAEARSFNKFIRFISYSTCTLVLSSVANPYYYIMYIELCCSTATFPSINSLGVTLSLFLGAEVSSLD